MKEADREGLMCKKGGMKGRKPLWDDKGPFRQGLTTT